MIEINEMNKNANGGTELFMRYLYNGDIPRELLEQFQIIPGRIRDLKEDKIRILTLHDLPDDPECNMLKNNYYRNKFHKIVFISNWQSQLFHEKLNIPYTNHSIVIENGLKRFEDSYLIKPNPQEMVNISYFTTPHRGLSILVPAFLKLAENDSKIHLHVHSSFKAYGWENGDKQFEKLFEVCRNHPQITYHGFTEYNTLREKMKDYHIFAYPAVWKETACRAMIEAMGAGMLCIHPNHAALYDTSGGLNSMYNTSEILEEHFSTFYQSLEIGIKSIRENILLDRLKFNKMFVDIRYDPLKITQIWISLLEYLINKFSTIDSRKLPDDDIIFV